MKKLKLYLVKLGQIIATLLMFFPIVVAASSNRLNQQDFWIFLISSILYDIYYYTVIEKENNMKSVKSNYYNSMKNLDKKLGIQINDKEKIKQLETYIETLLNDFF